MDESLDSWRITEGRGSPQRHDEAEKTRMLEGVRRALDDVRAGRTQPISEAFDDLRRELNQPGEP